MDRHADTVASASAEAARLWKGFGKYPALRDVPLKTAASWIAGRKLDDDYGQLWRVHDKLYDLSDFVGRHPGGSQWIHVTQGMDITEAFVTSHLSNSADAILAKYYCKPATGSRNSPYTFDPDGFYLTLRRRVQHYVKAHPDEWAAGRSRSVRVQNALLALLCGLFWLTAYWQSWSLAALTGLVLALNTNCAHNFYHQRDNWRMRLWDLSLLSSYEWRITHALSHHVYPNTIADFEVSMTEPFFDLKVHSGKSALKRHGALALLQLTMPVNAFLDALRRVVTVASGQQQLRAENLFPAWQLVVLYACTHSAATALALWTLMHASCSYWFGLIGLAAAHHHPDLYHAGDDWRYGRDWGLGQLDAVRDRSDVEQHFAAVLTMYGTHALHHLFPTLDHGQLDQLYPLLRQTCAQFGVADFVPARSPFNQWRLLRGLVHQLARVQPRKLD